MEPSALYSSSTATVQNRNNTVWTIENLLYFDKVLAEKHRVNVTAMYSAEKLVYDQSQMSGTNLPANYLQYFNLGLADGSKTIEAANQDYYERGLLSYSSTNTYTNAGTTRNGLLNQPIKPGDTAFVMLPQASAAYKATKNYRIWTFSELSRDIFPALKNFFDPNRQDINDASDRPFLLAKLSETYLIAAEAAVKTNQNTKAYSYILTLRKRAASSQANVQAMVDATPATITIDYILDERSRELCGEQMRWFDLKRTGKWRDRATKYTVGSTTFTHDIKSHYDLRPVPDNQINLMGNTDAEKKEYQNPGY